MSSLVHWLCHQPGTAGGGAERILLIPDNDAPRIVEYDMQLLGSSVFLYLQQLNDLSEEQSRKLVKGGIAIGRPNGYTFANAGFLYLLALHVNLFGLISSGYAQNIQDTLHQDTLDYLLKKPGLTYGRRRTLK